MYTTIFIKYFIKFDYILLLKKVIIYLYISQCHIRVKYAKMTHQVTHLKI